jgi:hypothetical protein
LLFELIIFSLKEMKSSETMKILNENDLSFVKSANFKENNDGEKY